MDSTCVFATTASLIIRGLQHSPTSLLLNLFRLRTRNKTLVRSITLTQSVPAFFFVIQAFQPTEPLQKGELLSKQDIGTFSCKILPLDPPDSMLQILKKYHVSCSQILVASCFVLCKFAVRVGQVR